MTTTNVGACFFPPITSVSILVRNLREAEGEKLFADNMFFTTIIFSNCKLTPN